MFNEAPSLKCNPDSPEGISPKNILDIVLWIKEYRKEEHPEIT